LVNQAQATLLTGKASKPMGSAHPPPLLAQDSKEVLQTVLAFSDSELDRLEQEQVIKTSKV